MKSKYILLIVLALGLLALAAMLAVQQQPQEEAVVAPTAGQQLPTTPNIETVEQNVEITAPSEGGATTSAESTLEAPAQEPEALKETGTGEPETVTSQPAFVDMMDGGFLPASLTLAAGTTVTFKNSSNRPIWPASAMHPTHAAYPTKGGCLGSTFDSCKGVNPGETWTFTFYENGTWKYHDHLNPSMTGSITIE